MVTHWYVKHFQYIFLTHESCFHSFAHVCLEHCFLSSGNTRTMFEQFSLNEDCYDNKIQTQESGMGRGLGGGCGSTY